MEDEIDASIQEVNRLLGEAGLTSAAASSDSAQFTPSMKAVLSVEYK